MNEPLTEPFSARYDLVCNAEVFTWPDEEAVMDAEMFEKLADRFGDPPVGFIEGLHYHFKPEASVPGASVAVPEDNHADPSALLIQK